jgi:hypothetical protein
MLNMPIEEVSVKGKGLKGKTQHPIFGIRRGGFTLAPYPFPLLKKVLGNLIQLGQVGVAH